MKLFKSLLVAPATIGLLAPISATANELNLNDVSGYSSSEEIQSINDFNSELAVTNSRVDSLEVQVNEFEAGGFSDTTVMDGKAVFDIGAIDLSETESSVEAVQFAYSYRLNLNTSFTGDDNLYVRLLAGNHTSGWMKSSDHGGYLTSVGKGDGLTVDKIWYSFPVGENNTVWVGPKIENYYMHGAAPSIYKPVTKQFALGGNLSLIHI